MHLPMLTSSTIARRLAATGALVLAIASSGLALTAAAGTMPAPVFVTTVDGTTTNPATYASRDDVYLGASACPGVAGAPVLAAGEYYFEVTDQTGTVVLSTDRLADRLFEVDATGAIVRVLVHDFGTNACATGPGGVVVKLQPFGLLLSGQTQYTVHVAPRSSVERCPTDTPFCDPTTLATASFAIAPYAVSPSPSPSPQDSGAASPAPSDSGAASPAPSDSGAASPAPSDSASPSDSGTATPTPSATPSGSDAGSPPPTDAASPSASPAATPPPTATPSATPNPTPGPSVPPTRTPAPTPPPAGNGGPGWTNTPVPTPTWTPYVPPSGFFICKPNEVITPTGCKTQAELAGQSPKPTAGSGGNPYGPTNPPQPGGGVIGVPPTVPPTASDSPGGGSSASPVASPGVSPAGSPSALPSSSVSIVPPAGSATPSPSDGAIGGSATPTLVAGNPGTGGGGPQPSDAAIANPSVPVSAAAGDPAAAATSARDRNVALVAMALLAGVTIGAASFAARILRRRRRIAGAR